MRSIGTAALYIPHAIKVLAWPKYEPVESFGDLSVLDCGFAADIAKDGDLGLLKWARANGCEWDERVCERAAKNGDLAVLQWAKVNDCEWDATTCSSGREQRDVRGTARRARMQF